MLVHRFRSISAAYPSDSNKQNPEFNVRGFLLPVYWALILNMLMAQMTPNPVQDAVYGFKNNAYTFDILGRNKSGVAYKKDEKKSARDSFFSMIENWAYSLPVKTMWLLYIGDIPQGISDDLINSLNPESNTGRKERHTKNLDELAHIFATTAGTGGKVPLTLFSVKNPRKNIFQQASERLEEVSGMIKNVSDIFSGKAKFFKTGGNATLFGCRFVDDVGGLPGENLGYKAVSESNLGGMITGYASSGRETHKPLTIGFKDTNTSFIDFVIRPWILGVARYGLIASNNEEERMTTTINIVEYARAVNGKESVACKQWIFFDAAPISIDDDTLKYTDDATWPIKKTKWIYSNYVLINYHGRNEEMVYQLPKGKSYFERFIPGSVTSTLDSVLGGDGATSDILKDTLPF